MQERDKYENPQQENKQGMPLKTKLVIAGVGLVGAIGLVVWIDRTRKQIAANKSNRESFSADNAQTKAKLIKMGMTKKITDFETSLNRAAEEAALKAAPVFVDAITNMSLQDGFAILKGVDTAATNYLRKTTYNPLKDKFLPIVKEAVAKVKVTSYWLPLATAYNKLPGVKKQNPNLDEYVTNKTINGLMLLIADEEIKIRKDPMARVSDLLKKVFGA